MATSWATTLPPNTCPAVPFPFDAPLPAATTTATTTAGIVWSWAIPSMFSAIFLASTIYATFKVQSYSRRLRRSSLDNTRLKSRIAQLEGAEKRVQGASKDQEVTKKEYDDDLQKERDGRQALQSRVETLTSELSALRVRHTLLSERALAFEILATQPSPDAHDQHDADGDVDEISEEQVVSLLEAMNAAIAQLGAGLAAEGVSVITELEGALQEAKTTPAWTESVDRDREREKERRQGTQVDADGGNYETGGEKIFEHAVRMMSTSPPTRPSPPQQQQQQQRGPTQRGHTPIYFLERRLSDSPASLHEVELPVPSAPTPSAPPLSSRMYPYPYSNQQQPMGIPMSVPLPAQSGPLSSSTSTLTPPKHPQQQQQQQRNPSPSPYNMQKALHAQREKVEAHDAAMREEVDEASGQAVEVFGEQFVGMLRGVVGNPRNLRSDVKAEGASTSATSTATRTRILNLAFRTALCAYTHWMVCSWFFEDGNGGVGGDEHRNYQGKGDTGDGEGLEGFLGEVYARVREGEEQAVSGRWRAITRKHVQRMLSGRSRSSSLSSSLHEHAATEAAVPVGAGAVAEEIVVEDTLLEELCVYIIDALVNVLIVAGVHGGWYLDPAPSSASSSSSSLAEKHTGPTGGPVATQEGYDMLEGDAGYVDVYHDPYEGFSISQLSEFLAVTPTVESFNVASRDVRRGPSVTSSSAAQPHPLSQTRNAQAQARARREALRDATREYTHTHLHALLTAKFKPELVKILERAKELNRVLGEGVVKCDLEALYVAPGVAYDDGTMMYSGLPVHEDSADSAVSKRVAETAVGKEVEEEEGQEIIVGVREEDEMEEGEDGDETPRTGGSPNVNSAVPSQYHGDNGRQPLRIRDDAEMQKAREVQEKQREEQRRREVEMEVGHELEVLCTTDLGLVRAEKVPKTRGEWDEVVLVKPRVVLVGEVKGQRLHTAGR